MDTPPVVFVSSTVEDLQPFRLAARDAAIQSGFRTHMLEYFPSSGQHRPLPYCLSAVSESDVLVVILAKRSNVDCFKLLASIKK